MVVEVTLHHATQPSPDGGHRSMPSPVELRLHLPELRPKTLLDRLTLHEEFARRPCFPADVRETEKIERLRRSLAALLPPLDGVPTKLQQTRFVWVQLQPKPLQARLPRRQASLGVLSMLKSHDDVISVPNHDHFPGRLMRTPV